MKIMDWEGVEETHAYLRPPVGGYVVRIVDVEDVAHREYLNIVYDICEGDLAGFYDDDFGRRNPWAHRFVRSYKETAQGMFKSFLLRLEESNPEFSIARWTRRCDPRGLIGLTLGVVLQYEDYTGDDGRDKERLQVVQVISADDAREGRYKVPERADRRRGGTQAQAGAPAPAGRSGGYGAVYADDLPF